MDKLNVIKLAKDMIQNKVDSNFADASKNSDALREALVEANGGSTKIDIRTFHKGNELFEIVQEIIPTIVHEGLTGNEFFYNLVEYRNIALGDEIEFLTEDKVELVVADASYGVSGIRRQRLGRMESYTIDTTFKVIKVYEELKRLLAGRTDFNQFIDAAGRAMQNKILDDTYTAFKGVTATTRGLNSTYVQTGSYTDDALLELVDHVEAANNSTATIFGTKMALRKINADEASNEGKSDMYNMGYYGKFFGTNVVYLPQRHVTGTDNFLLDNNKVYVIAGSDKPIKVVNVGEGLLSTNDPLQAPDFSQNYLYGQEMGIGLAFNEKVGFMNLA